MIRWITDQLGTSAWDDARSRSGFHLVDVRELVDKRGNPVDLIRAKISEAVDHLKRGEKVVICCDYGISRSNSVAAGVLSVYEQIAMDEAVRRVLEATEENAIKVEVLSAVRQALEMPNEQLTVADAILVTGASGFVGAAVTKTLRKQERNIVTPSSKELDLRRAIIKLDMLVKQHGVRKIVHLASPRVYTTNESMGVTLWMLKNVLDVCTQNDASLVYVSSWEIYSGYRAQHLIAAESLPALPGGTYGQTKFLAETLIKHYIKYRGLECTLLRSSPVYGAQNDRPRFIWNFLSKARQDQEIVTHQYLNGFPALDLLHISDLQAAMLAALDAHASGEFNIGRGVGVSTADVAAMLVEKTGSRSRIRHQRIEEYASSTVMDTSRAKRILGWQPAVDISQGLDEYVQAAIPGAERTNDE